MIDQRGETINRFEFGLALPQFGEMGSPGSDNDVVGDYDVSVSAVSFTSESAVPEPSSTLVVGLLMSLGLITRRR